MISFFYSSRVKKPSKVSLVFYADSQRASFGKDDAAASPLPFTPCTQRARFMHTLHTLFPVFGGFCRSTTVAIVTTVFCVVF